MRKRVLLTWLAVAALVGLVLIPSTIESALAAPTATAGGGSSDFLLKVASGVSGPPSQWFWDPVTIGGLARAPIGGATSQAPAIAQYNKQFQIMVLGTDGQVWQAWYDSTVGVWYPWVHLPVPSSGPSGGFTSAPSVTTYNGQFHVVVRGGSNNHLWHAYYDPASGWHGWEDLTPSGAVGSASAPAVASYTGSGDRTELHVFYVSDDSSKTLMEMVFNKLGGPGNSWTAPVSVGAGPWASAPAATQYGDQLQLWAVLGADHHLYQYFHGPSGGFAGPYGLSNDVVGSAPAVAQYKTQFQVWYVMGDVGGSTVTKQAYYDSATGAWTMPFVWGSMSSAPAITTFGSEFQVWWRDTP